MRSVKILSVCLPLIALIGCGGTSIAPPPTSEQFVEQGMRATGTYNRFENLTPTVAADMPTAGRATFTGKAVVDVNQRLEVASDTSRILGDTTLVARFGRGTITGQIDNMVARSVVPRAAGEGPSYGPTLGAPYAVDGQIDIGQNASSIGDGAGSTWSADARGTMVLSDGAYDVTSDLTGQFFSDKTGSGPDRLTGSGRGQAIKSGDDKINSVSIRVFGTRRP